MPLTERNLETTLRLLTAHKQRYGEVEEIAGRLTQANFYRSPDGTLAVGQFSAEEKEALAKRIDDVLAEGDVIAASIRANLASE